MSRKTYPTRVARLALGIRAQDLRTLLRKNWWARRWVAALESFRLGARLGRGRQYALLGQVTELRICGPHVEASVLGSRPKPYTVTLDFTIPAEDVLAGIAARLKQRPDLLARLLADDLPTELETFFTDAGTALFPVSSIKPPYDVRMTCSCPDWSKPCKHMACVLFLLGEEIARHPSTLLALRGLDMESFFPTEVYSEESVFSGADTPAAWNAGLGTPPATALLTRLGPIPFWRGTTRCLEALSRIYTRVQPVAAAAAQGEGISIKC